MINFYCGTCVQVKFEIPATQNRQFWATTGEKRNAAEIQIYDGRGRRKYLTDKERKQFLASADRIPANKRGTGLRISEAS
jgi:hypothetical protein